jgi:hypothetical protein
MRGWTVALALVSFGAQADDLTPETVARIRREQDAADKKLAKAHGDKKHSEMSQDERREFIEEQRKARAEVLDKHGLNDKEYSRYEARQSKEDRLETSAADKRLADKEKEKEEADKHPKKKDEPIPIQRGFGKNGQSVEMERKEGAPPVVEHGLPPEEEGGKSR